VIDSHCHLDHLDLEPWGGDLSAALDAARADGVRGFLCINVDLATADAMRQKVGAADDVWFAMGQHPEGVAEVPDPAALDACLRGPRVVAVGETGLDYFRIDASGADAKVAEAQRESFTLHLEAGRRHGLPVVVHTREAHDDTVALVRAHGGPDAGVIHCFTEGWDEARRYLDLGFRISLSGIVTFRSADALRDVARRIPADRLLIETDSPWLAPVPHRGRSNEPRYVVEVARTVAALQGLSVPELVDRTTENFFALFPRAA
jgi:TatD DNase family protein